MIDLTPLEVRQKKGDFRRSMRGYDAELVNDFLDLVADRMEELVKENMGLKDRVADMEQELDRFKEKERALSDALMTAQKLREEARSHAEKEGELLVREARTAAESARSEVTRQLAREEETLRQVRARRSQLIDSFRRLLERELSELAVIEEALDLRGKVPPATASSASGGQPQASTGAPPQPEQAASAEASPQSGSAPAPSATGAEGKPAGVTPEEDARQATSTRAREAGETAAAGGPEEPRDAVAENEAVDRADAEPRRRSKGDREVEPGPLDDAVGLDLQEDWLTSLVEEE